MKISNRQIILNVLNEKNGWMPLWDFIKVETKWGWLGTSARSRIQELAEEKKIEHRLGSKEDPMMFGKYSWYRTKPIEYQTYYVRDFNGNIEKTIKVPKVETKLQTNLF